jgi:hypothetical protein
MEIKSASIAPRFIVFPAELLGPTKVNSGLIVFKKEQHHTQMLVVLTVVYVFGMLCRKLQFGLCMVSCALYIVILCASYLLHNEQLEGKGDGESLVKLPARMLVRLLSLHAFV